MEPAKQYFMRNIAPAIGMMTIFILGAILVYKGFYAGQSNAADYAGLEPAAGMEIIYDDGQVYIPVSIDNIPVWVGEQAGEH